VGLVVDPQKASNEGGATPLWGDFGVTWSMAWLGLLDVEYGTSAKITASQSASQSIEKYTKVTLAKQKILTPYQAYDDPNHI
jgi:hypothetical protein